MFESRQTLHKQPFQRSEVVRYITACNLICVTLHSDDMSYDDLSRLSGVDKQAIFAILDERPVKKEAIIAIENALGVRIRGPGPPKTIYGWTSPPQVKEWWDERRA